MGQKQEISICIDPAALHFGTKNIKIVCNVQMKMEKIFILLKDFGETTTDMHIIMFNDHNSKLRYVSWF